MLYAWNGTPIHDDFLNESLRLFVIDNEVYTA